MELRVGDSVVHPTYGVGHVVHVENKKLTEAQPRLYYQVVMDSATVWIPAESFEKIGMRQLPPRRDLANYRALLKTLPASFDANHSKRRMELAERLKIGSFQSLCELVRDLTALGWRKPLGTADAVSLRRAYERLCREWSAVDKISVEEAQTEIDALLDQGKQTFLRRAT